MGARAAGRRDQELGELLERCTRLEELGGYAKRIASIHSRCGGGKIWSTEHPLHLQKVPG